MTLSEDQAIPPESSRSHHALSVLEYQVSNPPRSSFAISIDTKTSADVEGVIVGNQRLLLDREICVARGIARLHGRKTNVVLTNFSQELKHIHKVTKIA